tara:strand:- start:2258 stop:2476 length:219 start_codon:yes stop_codon:yes gene_type:complete
MLKGKILLTISFLWIILVGYLTWFNKPQTFQWDEWVWFGLVPALAPYIFLFIWKPTEFAKFISCIKNLFISK